MAEIELRGLPGTNPLGFMAALGVQVAFESEARAPALRWADGVVPTACVSAELDLDDIVQKVLATANRWAAEPALNPAPAADDVKFRAAEIREYLQRAAGTSSGRLAMALVAEGSLDAVTGKVAKPTDFHFTAGRQLFLRMARRILADVTAGEITSALCGPWQYDSALPSLRWDVADDRAYALSAFDPTDNTNNPKLTNPGAECLALLGLCMFPAFIGTGKTATTGCSGTWRNGAFSWPLWSRPASPRLARTFVAQIGKDCLKDRRRSLAFPSLGVFRVMESAIRRNDRAMGLANFGPPKVIWQRD